MTDGNEVELAVGLLAVENDRHLGVAEHRAGGGVKQAGAASSDVSAINSSSITC